MTVRDPFRPAGCTCEPGGKLRAALEEREEPLCRVHEVEAIAARDAAAARRQAEYDIAVIRDAIRAASPPRQTRGRSPPSTTTPRSQPPSPTPSKPQSPKPKPPTRSMRPNPKETS